MAKESKNEALKFEKVKVKYWTLTPWQQINFLKTLSTMGSESDNMR